VQRANDSLCQEIAERKIAQETLRVSEEKFRLAFQTSPDSINLNRVHDDMYQDINEGFTKILGYAREEAIGKTSLELNIWDDPKDRERLVTALEREGFVENMEARFHGKNGTNVIGLMSARVLHIGREDVILSITRDITERKRAEAALRESEELYRTLVSLSPDAISMADMDGRLTFASPKARQLFGDLPDDEILGRPILSWVAPEEQEKASANIGHLLTAGTLTATEFTLVKKDGTRFVGEVNAAVIHSPDGSPMSMIIITRDVTERKRIEEELLRSQRQLADIIEFLPDPTLVINNEGTVIAWNRAMEEMSGISKSNMIGKGDFEYSLPFFGSRRPILIDLLSASEEKKMELYESVSTVGGAIVAETYAPQAYGGKGAYLWSVATALFDGQGNVAGAIESLRDVTERKRSDAERTLLATAVEQAEENILVTDDRRTILYINPAFERSSGYRLEDLKGEKLRVLRSDRHDEAFHRNMKETLDYGEVWMGLIINKGKDGTDFEIEGTISPLRDASGSITNFVAAGRNMSRFRKLERELYQAQKMESVGRLAGGVAHDFNNMLGVIIGRTEMALKQDIPTDKLQHNLREILKAGQRSADLTRQLLAFARKQTAIPKILDLNDTILGMLRMLRRLIGEDIDLAWQPGLDLWKVKIDPSQVDQILANLMVNASDAISGIGAITLRTDNVVIDDSNRAETGEFIPGQFVLLTVSDTGVGMSQEVCENIFEPFFTTKEVGKGTGLGLSTVYGIVKQNDGFISVASEQGKGTTFGIYLPRFEVETAQVPSEQITVNRPTGTETILLVEDDEAILDLSKMILEELGYTVLAAHAPVYALHLVEEHPGDIHLLITDVVMPEMNGRELAEQLITVRPNLKCLYMSGYTADVIARRGILDEGVNFIQKPFGSEVLAARVRQALDHLE